MYLHTVGFNEYNLSSFLYSKLFLTTTFKWIEHFALLFGASAICMASRV